MNWGRFTFSRDQTVEQMLTGLVKEVGDVVFSAVPPSQRRALLLIGGYGRGEGGVERTAEGPRPHNNLDFLLVTRETETDEQLLISHQVNRELAPLRERHQIGIDFSAIDEKKLLDSPSLVMWYDMRHGHKTVLGDAEFAPSLTRFQADKIPAWNVRDLLVNRGTLLVINRWLRDHGDSSEMLLSEEQRLRIAMRHLIKAVIGYGDALLYFMDSYHWSYVEKLHRMQDCRLADPEFVRLYSNAVAFRFEPDYGMLGKRDVLQWQEDVLPLLSHVHLCCESARLGRVLTNWSEYPAAAARGALCDDWRSPRQWVRKAVHCLGQLREPMPQRGIAGWGLRAAGPRGRLSLAFPGVIYNDPSLRTWAAGLLNSAPGDAELARAYLNAWGTLNDTNFATFVDSTGLSLAPQPAAPQPLADQPLAEPLEQTAGQAAAASPQAVEANA